MLSWNDGNLRCQGQGILVNLCHAVKGNMSCYKKWIRFKECIDLITNKTNIMNLHLTLAFRGSDDEWFS
jgi:hypothetical protein